MSTYLHSIASVLLLALLATACEKNPPPFECQDKIGCVRISPGGPLKIGVLQALSGKVATLGTDQLYGINLAIDTRKGSFLNHPIVLQTEDTGCTAEGGANAALELIADTQMAAILGTTCSGAAALAADSISQAGLTMISGNNSAPFLTSIAGQQAPNWHAGYFRTSGNEESAGQTAALYAYNKLGVRKAATINDGDIYTRGLTLGFEKSFSEQGGQIVLSTAVNKGEKEMRPVLKAVLNSRAELLFFPLFQPEANHLLLKAKETTGYESIVLMSNGALIESSFIEDVQSAAQGMYFIGPAYPEGPAIDALAEAYLSKFKSRPATSYYLSAYDAANLLLDTLEKVAIQAPDGTLHFGRHALREALYATKEYPGITGDLTCDRFGDCADPVFNVLRLKDPKAGVDGLRTNVLFTFSPKKPLTK